MKDLITDRLAEMLEAAREEGRQQVLKAAVSAPANPLTPHPGWLVWQPDTGMPRYTHHTLGTARTEAERLAKAYLDKPFYVLAPIGAAICERKIMPVTFSAVPHVAQAHDLDDEIPF